MKENKPVYVLGTGLSPHDGSACLLKDGVISVAIEKERITRIKHDGYNDNLAIEYCLRKEGIDFKDLDLIVQCGDSNLYYESYNKVWNVNGIRVIENESHGVRVVNISHHLAHAYNAIGSAPFDEMAILVIDGHGQSMNFCTDLENAIIPTLIQSDLKHLFYETDSFYYYKDGKITSLFKDFSSRRDTPILSMFPYFMTNSIGEMYEQASAYCVGSANKFNFGLAGKLMGLAPYGKSGVYKHEMFDFKDSRVFVKYGWQKEFNKPCINYEDFQLRFDYFANIARWVQEQIEKALLFLINERFKLSLTKNLAYTGGVALNAVANSKILDNSGFENLFITPAAGDNGLSLGCAYYGWLEVLKKQKLKHDGNSCFGKVYSDKEILNTLENYMSNDLIDIQYVVSAFFENIQHYLINENIPNDFFAIQFIVDDCGMYIIEFNNNTVSLKKDAPKNVQIKIKILGHDFIYWMQDLSKLPLLISEKKISIEGDFSKVETCFAPTIINSSINKLIELGTVNKIRISFKKERDVISKTADLLSKGNVIGWFQGGSEFGPRALGHRSILADPRLPHVQKFINSRVKFREDFRPFAPSVLLEDVSEYFQFEKESPYMILVAKVRAKYESIIPGVIHKDKSCRIQTVTKEWNSRYYDLLMKFKECTGISVLLNTSFNRQKMPIVETPEEALRFFYECDLHCLVIGDFIVHKSAIIT